jgi:hypothetical protein
MTNLECFGAYAADFEKTYKDDDWSRLDRYFAPDATYQVTGEPFTATLKGRDAIFKGIKKSLDGFDRRFATRDIALEGAPEVEGDTVSLPWAVTYNRAGNPPLVLRGRSKAKFAGERIVELTDSYDQPAIEVTTAWMRQHGRDLDPSYT